MEVRRINHGKGKLSTTVCIADDYGSEDYGFRVASVIVMGEKEAVVIDTQFTLANAHRVAAEVLDSGRSLKAVILSHAHPDHYFGTEVFQNAFPEAAVYALEEDIQVMHDDLFGKIEHWEKEIGITNCPHKPFNVTPLKEGFVELEGEKIEVKGKVWGDKKYNSRIWIPSIKTLIGSDILFNEAHPFTCELTRKQWKHWIDQLNEMESMDAEVIIPGHARPGMPFDKSSIEYTRNYLIATAEEVERCKTPAEFYYAMSMRFPKSVLLRSNEMNANVFLGGREWYDAEENEEDIE